MGIGSDWEQANSGCQALADQEGFITVWPQGLENASNIGPCCTTSRTVDDFGFARAMTPGGGQIVGSASRAWDRDVRGPLPR
jgi:poly(3-hydroxybutyrate) depolymerase